MSLESDTESIFQTYPRHKDKRYALLAIEKALRRLCAGETGRKLTHPEAVEFLLHQTALFAKSPAGSRGHLTPFPATWMNRGAYLDDPAEWEYLSPQEVKTFDRLTNANVGVSQWRPI